MKFDRDDLVLAAYVARASKLEPCVIGSLLTALKRLSRRHHNAALQLCNDADYVSGGGYEKIAALEDKAASVALELGLPMSADRDPRGSRPFCFRLPDGRSNSMGGEEWVF